MLQLNDITKEYVTGDSTVHALRGVSLKFRESEFVSILGQSGCGKTTLLNIIGGLDQYTDGDLIINGKSTKEFKDRDWDTYRNHSIGFIFQSYNLIPHQTVLANVEIALTLAGVSKKERRERAIKALETVGLGDQINKKPNQMSGGQMQRVAIARALINNPDILLADEPTGALDSETSVQVMDLLKEIAKDRLVIMVTHNPELANQYSTRIINLLDGQVVNDSNPVLENESVESLEGIAKNENVPTPSKGKKKKTSMSFLTALSLSLNNLMTKKGRTFLTAFAGSIGIIGIALILSVSTGVNAYIKSIEESTMSSYPIEINESSMDTMSLLGSLLETNKIEDFSSDTIYSNDIMIRVMESFASGLTKNDLVSLKQYLDSEKADTIKNNATDIKYIYDAGLNTYTPVLDDSGNIVRHEKNKESLGELLTEIGLGNFFGDASASLDMLESNSWTELVGSSEYISSQYQLVAGKVPDVTNPYEVVLITDQNNQISDFILYTIGIKSTEELKKWVNDQSLVLNGKKDAEDAYKIPSLTAPAESFIGYEFKIIPDSELYKLDDDGKIVERNNDEIEAYLKSEDAISVKVVGIMKPIDSSNSLAVLGSVGYTSALMNQIIDLSNNSDVIKAQLENTDRNLQTGLLFNGYNPNTALIDTIIGMDPQYRDFIASMTPSQKVEILKTILGSTALSILAEQPYGEFTSDDLPMIKNTLSSISDSTISLVASAVLNDTDENILKIFNQMLVTTTYDEHMEQIGYINKDVPKQILIYPKDFDAKDIVKGELDAYNNSLPEDSNKRITYSDPVASLMGSITTIVDAITYVLIAFVSISLIVSSIMIGIITYISVLERTKEIGILRAVGASKKDISRVFNAETLIVGFAAGAIGIIVTLVLDLIITAILFALTQIATLKAVLDFWPAIILILISMGLTFIAGLVPSKIAAKKDPVIALRSE